MSDNLQRTEGYEGRMGRLLWLIGLDEPDDLSTLNNGEGLTFELEPFDISDPGSVPRYLLIERGKYGDDWCTLWHTPKDAADYHDGQEYIEDWGDYRLYDLDTGDEFYPEVTTTWVKSETV